MYQLVLIFNTVNLCLSSVGRYNMVLDYNPSDILGQHKTCVSTKNLASLLHQMLSEPEFKRQSLEETSPVSKIGKIQSLGSLL